MNTRHLILTLLALTMTLSGVLSSGWADAPKMKMTTDIPESITTPDRVETRIGTLEFFDGIPTKETADLVYDYLDFSRAMETFLNGIPAASIEALRLGAAALGQKNSNQVLYFDELMDSKALFLTGNTSTVYAIPILDLKKDGPTVVEIPAGAGPGTVNDAFFRFVIDMGAPGPDKGKGGKYLILPPDYEGDLEGPIGGKAQVIDGETYFVAKSTSYVNWIALRGFLVDGKPDAAAKMWRDGLKIYPLAKEGQSAEDGVHQRLRQIVQHDPRQQFRVLRGTPHRHRTRTRRDARPRAARTLRLHRDREGQAFRPGRADEEDHDRSGGGGQRDGTRHALG
jgi:hypothetical protein